MNERLLYNNIKKIPATFEEREINLIINQLIRSKDYWKNDLGEWARHRDICLVATIYLLALRPLEACRLKFEDFNFRTATVKIHGSKVHRDRILPIPYMLMNFYREYFKFPKRRFWKGSPYIFPSYQNNHISPQTLKAIFREKALKPLGLWNMPKNSKAEFRTLYKLRHSRATHILQKQIKKNGSPDLFAIANLLGHSDIRSTTVYLHADKNYTKYLRDQINL